MKNPVDSSCDVAHVEKTESKNDSAQTKTLSDEQYQDDIAGEIVTGEVHYVTPEENKRVLRRIDLTVMPFLFLSYGFQFMDKALLGNAAQFGIIEDLHLYQTTIINGTPTTSLTRFSHATIMFYWGFVAGCIPGVYLAQRFPIGKFCGVAMTVWGIATMAAAGTKSYAGLMVLRFFLGFVESSIPPALSLVTAMWYKPEEQPFRHCLWISSGGLFGLLGAILLWGIGHIQGELSPWKYQYLILGALTVVWGIIVFFFLPDSPVEARYFSHEEKVIAVERLRDSQTGVKNQTFKWYQVREALLDVKTWAYVAITFCVEFTNGAASGFGSIIVRSFGFTGLQSVLLNGALSGIVFVTLVVAGLIASYFQNQRINVSIACCVPVIWGAVIMWKSDWAHRGVPLFGFLSIGFFVVPYVLLLAVMTANTGGYTKRAINSALMWGSYCVTNGVAPLIVKAPEAHDHYPTLMISLMVLLSLAALMFVGLRFYLQRCNNKRDQVAPLTEEETSRTAFGDLTDGENPNFRYSW